MNSVLSSLVQENVTGDSLTLALTKIRNRLKAITASQLVRPESFGAVANSAAAAAANRTALQNWLNAAATGGILFHNPSDVYYVQAKPIQGPNAQPALKIAYPTDLLVLRIKSKFVSAGNEQRLIELSYNESTTVYQLQNNAISRGQYTWVLPELPALAIGTQVLIMAGEDPYGGGVTNGLYLRAKVVSYDQSTGILVVDRPAPRGFSSVSSSPQPTLHLITSSGDNSSIGLLEIDQSEHGNTALDTPLVFRGAQNAKIGTYITSSATGGSVTFEAGAGYNVIENLDASHKANATLRGNCRITRQHDFENSVLSAAIQVYQPSNVLLGRAYAGRFNVGNLNVDVKGVNGVWADNNIYLSNLINGAETLQIKNLNVITAVDALGAGARTGIQIANSDSASRQHNISRLTCNKDVWYLGCQPDYLETKTIKGQRMQVERELNFPAVNAGAAVTRTVWLGTMYVDTVRYKYSDELPPPSGDRTNGFAVFLHSNTFDPAGASTDEITYGYGQTAIPANQIVSPANTWVNWQTPQNLSNVADGGFYNNCAPGIDKFLRFITPAVYPAKKIQISYAGYPVRAAFTSDNS